MTTAPTDAPTERVARDEVLVELDFAEPISPVLTPIGTTLNGSPATMLLVIITPRPPTSIWGTTTNSALPRS